MEFIVVAHKISPLPRVCMSRALSRERWYIFAQIIPLHLQQLLK